jgi:hypothetical protein
VVDPRNVSRWERTNDELKLSYPRSSRIMGGELRIEHVEAEGLAAAETGGAEKSGSFTGAGCKPPRQSIEQLTEKVRNITAARQAGATTQASPTLGQFLPGLTEDKRAMPNLMARSSLFAPIALGPRKFHRDTTLLTRRDAVMTYTGEQLDEADADLVMQLLYAARHQAYGAPVTLNRAALLRSMGRQSGNHDYQWLHRRIKALTVATLYIEARKKDGSSKYQVGKTKAFHIVSAFDYDDLRRTYTLTLDPSWRALFSNREYALINWPKRLQIRRGQNMAKTLQRMIAASADNPQHFQMDALKDTMQYASPMRKFYSAVLSAVEELRRLDILSASRIGLSTKGKQQLTVWR